MKLTLKEAMRSAEDGCLSDKEEITKVLQNLLATPAGEFPTRYMTDLKEMLSCGLEWVENVSNKEFSKYTYLDLICLSYITAQTLIRNEPEEQHCLLILSEYIFLRFLRRTASYCTWTDLFYTVNLEELLNVLDELAGFPHNSFGELIELTHRMNDSTFRYNITPKTTVQGLIEQTESVIRQYWRPWDDIKIFTADVTVGYEVIHMLAFKCIKNAFGSAFRKWEKEAEKRAHR